MINLTLNGKNWKELSRKNRGLLIAKCMKIQKTNQGWKVPSQSGNGFYFVKLNEHKQECNCPDCELNRKKCKHIWAVEFYVKQEINEEGKITETRGVKVTYGQKWSAYNKSQTNEKTTFMHLLNELCTNVEEPKYKFGRPKLPIQEMLFSSVMKVYSLFSLRRYISDLKIAQNLGFVNNVCSYSTISNFMNKKEITPILQELIRLSSLPLSTIETEFCADASGFSTTRFSRWYDARVKMDVDYRVWLKAHICCGKKTNIVTWCEATDGKDNDAPHFPKLIDETAKNFDLKEISADKGYSSRKNLKAVSRHKAIPYIPFKKNAIFKARGCMLWNKMYHYYLYKHEEFMKKYHYRSNVETVFHMVKSKFGEQLRSKKKTAQFNELLIKILCNNLCVVNQEINELGVKREFVIEKKINF